MIQEQLLLVLSYIKGIWRYRFYALCTAWLVAIVGWIFVINLPDQFEARARVYVDAESVLKPLLRGMAIDTNVIEQAALTKRALLSKPKLEKLVAETGLAQRLSDPSNISQLVEMLQAKVTIINERGSTNLFNISFIDSDREMARKVVEELVDAFVHETIGENKTESNTARNFLNEQIREYEKKLQTAEQRLADFKKKNVGLMPDNEGDYYARLQAATGRLEATRSDLKIAVTRRDTLRKQIEGEEPVFGFVGPESAGGEPVFSNPAVTNSELDRLRNELDNLLLTRTENHPDVVSLRETIAALEKQEKSSKKTVRTSSQPSVSLTPEQSMALNPVYQSMQIALSESEAEVAALEQKLIQEESEVTRLKDLIDTIPEVEAELTRLNRDYTVNQNQYEALLHRLSTAELSEQAERSEEENTIRIIDPAHASEFPVAPNRPLLIAVVAIGGLLIGGALAFLLSQIRPVFTNHYEIKNALGVPVLGVVTHILTEEERKRKLLFDKILVGSLGALLLSFGVVVSIV